MSILRTDARVLLPDPDSPAIPSIIFFFTEKLILFSIGTYPFSVSYPSKEYTKKLIEAAPNPYKRI